MSFWWWDHLISTISHATIHLNRTEEACLKYVKLQIFMSVLSCELDSALLSEFFDL